MGNCLKEQENIDPRTVYVQNSPTTPQSSRRQTKRRPIWPELTIVEPNNLPIEFEEERSVKGATASLKAFETATTLHSDSDSEIDHHDMGSSCSTEETTFRRTMDEILETFDLDHDGFLGKQDIQKLLDRYFGQGQFEAQKVIEMGGGKKGLNKKNLY